MSDNNLTVIAQIKVKEGMQEKMEGELLKLIEPSRSEPGCIVYDLYQSADDKQTFMFYECWKSKRDLDEHLQKPYTKAFIEKTEMFAEPLKVSLWGMISER